MRDDTPRDRGMILERTAISRRRFLVCAASAAAGLTLVGVGAARSEIILDAPRILLLADPTRCVGCGRCELACVEFNDGESRPSRARLQVSKCLHYGPAGALGGRAFGSASGGAWGDGLVAPNLCRQCPHPVPCATACPQDAVGLDPVVGARVIDPERCVGCKLCVRACPWGMIVFDEARLKASKCFLCGGKPKCVEACPAEALTVVPWRDVTREAQAIGGAMPFIPPDKARECLGCHGSGVSGAGASGGGRS